jgi:hypothetical protein
MMDRVGNLDMNLSSTFDFSGRKPTLVENCLQIYYQPYYLILFRHYLD